MATGPGGGPERAHYRYGLSAAVSSPPAIPRSSPPDDRRSPPALVTSVVFGIVGSVLLLAGLVVGNEPLVLSAVAAGTVSLISVLVWREQLISAWRGGRRPRP